MVRSSLYLALAVTVAATVFFSCNKRVNGVDNSQIIETPYSLFFSDTAGSLFNSNDGKTVQRTLFKADGFPCRSIVTVNGNILWAKNNLFISTNGGKNFNESFDSLTNYPFRTCDSMNYNLNQSMMLNIPDWGMVYTVSSNPDPSNYLGVVFSLNAGGARGSWWGDLPDTNGNIGAYTGNYPVTMTSYTMLKNGVLCGYDAMHNRNFYRLKTSFWIENTANPDSIFEAVGTPGRRAGNRLPHREWHYPASGLTSTSDTFAWYSYGHYNSRLIAIDNRSCNSGGAYYSDDSGRNWTGYAGLPARPLLCISSPFEEICLIGTDSAGLWFLNNNTNAWQQQTNTGLGKNLVVRNIAFKENIYKNGQHVKFIYLATNQGIYQSNDGGNHWTCTIPGNYVAIY